MYNTNISSAIGKGWALHRNGQYEQALTEFQRALGQSPDDLDALFGSGLAQKALGHKEAAAKSFQKAIDLAGKGLAEKPGDDRLQMLRRMCQQRINELTKPAAV